MSSKMFKKIIATLMTIVILPVSSFISKISKAEAKPTNLPTESIEEIQKENESIFELKAEDKNKTFYLGNVAYLMMDVDGILQITPTEEKTIKTKLGLVMEMDGIEKAIGKEQAERYKQQRYDEEVFIITYTNLFTGKFMFALYDGRFILDYKDYYPNAERLIYENRLYISQLCKRFNVDINNNTLGISEQDFDSRKTLWEIEELYKKIVPKKHWPIEQELEFYRNETLQDIPDELLDEPFEGRKIALALFLYSDRTKKMALAEFIKDSKSDSYNVYDIIAQTYICDGFAEKVNKEYLKNIYKKDTNPTILIYRVDELERESYLYYLKDEFKNVKTLRELIKAYQYLPLENQVEYNWSKPKKKSSLTNENNINKPVLRASLIPSSEEGKYQRYIEYQNKAESSYQKEKGRSKTYS